MMYILGFDIGGTKCAVLTARVEGDKVELLKKEKLPTDTSIASEKMIDKLMTLADGILEGVPDSIGISCGGPLDSGKGVILSPPNLPGWDEVPIVEIIKKRFNAPTHLQNDANACAVAEWKFGAGKGCRNMVFMTFGTGLGAGLILDGKLYEGTNGNAGEVGHVRLADDGPVGFGKAGSFEGFCSGGGISKLGLRLALLKGECAYFKNGMKEEEVTAKSIADAAREGDPTALEVFRISGRRLGEGLSILIDLLNPERIVIGSVFARCHDLLWDEAKAVIEREALSGSASCCRVVPASLGEEIGDFGAVATALL